MNATALISGLLACLLTLLLVPIVIRVCNRLQLLDQPGPLKIHSQAVPRLGGVAVVVALSTAVFSVQPIAAIRAWPFFASLALVWVVGIIDDVRSLSVLLRLAAQIAAGVLLWHGGWTVPLLGTGAMGLVATCFFVVTLINSFNFLDGSDGLAAGVAGIISAAYMFSHVAASNPFEAVLACSVAGACLGFLRSNFPPARVFLGDSGSTALGLSVAFLSLNFWRSGQPTVPRILFPILIAALPLLDGALAIIRRLSGGLSPLYGDRLHVCDRMMARGWSQRAVALACYGITSVFVAIAWWGVQRHSPQFWLVAALGAGLLTASALTLGSLRSKIEESPHQLATHEIRQVGKTSAGFD